MSVNHPGPTEATVKALYGTALRCAFPQCDEPLYRVDASGSTRTLNSRVAHICARSEGGPRWDSEMTPETNRSAENLVLLCVGHSYEIDDKALEVMYPASMIREWKTAQIAEYERAAESAGSPDGVGWRITGEEAAEVIAASESQVNIELNAHTIQIGGSGGYLGGAGGGGGVVGSGALIGGSGGDAQIPKIILDGQPGKFPGAGGGGAGALQPGTVTPPPRAGTEGRGYIAGVDGGDGGDTTIAIDGEIVLRAKGGKGGRAGSGIRATSDRLAVSALLLANHIAMMPHGLATLVDAGWQGTSVLNLPTPLNFPVLAVIEAGGVAAGEYSIIFELRAPSGEVQTSATIALVVERSGDLLRLPFSMGVPGTIDAYGLWQVVVKSEVAELGWLDIMVKRVGEAEPPLESAIDSASSVAQSESD
jgi:hypothetical protein